MKGLLVFAVLWGAATSFAAADPLAAARRALGDELWSVAARSAAEAALCPPPVLQLRIRIFISLLPPFSGSASAGRTAAAGYTVG